MTNNYRPRATIIFVVICGAFIFLTYRLYSIQITHHSAYISKQQGQFYHKEKIPLRAGMILDRNGKILALSKAVDSVYATPEIFKQNQANIKTVSNILKIPQEKIKDRLKWAEDNHKSFIWLKRRINLKESSALRARKIKGIGFRKEYKRFYPNGPLACHILGFRGVDEKALGGAELAYDKYLMGEKGYHFVPHDARMQKLTSLELAEKPPQPGKNIYLTIDTVIQFIVEDELDKACAKWRPKSAEVIVLKPATGEILALANRPAFDPNRPTESPLDTHRNRAITDPYEPGSVFKPFIACVLLVTEMAQISETILCENGAFKLRRRIIHDHRPFGSLTFTDVVAKSSNIGMAKLGLRLGKNNMYHYLSRFGFGKSTELGLPAEASGIITPFDQWDDYTLTSVPMGHEIAATSIQLIKAFNVFANNGILVKPYLMQKVTDSDGKINLQSKPTPIRQVINNRTANQMRTILRAVVEKGTGKRARIKDYTIAGKTGTAQKLNPDGTYSHSKFRSTFIGFAPVENPQVLVLVMLNEPQDSYYGGTVAAPTVANIIQKTLKYLQVPSRTNIATTD